MAARQLKRYQERVEVLPHLYKRVEEPNVEWMAGHFLGNHEETRRGALTRKKGMDIFFRFL